MKIKLIINVYNSSSDNYLHNKNNFTAIINQITIEESSVTDLNSRKINICGYSGSLNFREYQYTTTDEIPVLLPIFDMNLYLRDTLYNKCLEDFKNHKYIQM